MRDMPYEEWQSSRPPKDDINKRGQRRLPIVSPLTDPDQPPTVPEIDKCLGSDVDNIIDGSRKLGIMFPGKIPKKTFQDFGLLHIRSGSRAYSIRNIARCRLIVESKDHLPPHLETLIELTKFANKCLDPTEDPTTFNEHVWWQRIIDGVIHDKMHSHDHARELQTHGNTLENIRKIRLQEALADPDCGDGQNIFDGDFSQLYDLLADNMVHQFHTDLPWGLKYLDLHGELAKLAALKLEPGGFCSVRIGRDYTNIAHIQLSQYLTFHGEVHIQYGRKPMRHLRGWHNNWQSILVYCKPPVRKVRALPDWITGTPDKRYHEWGHAEGEAGYFIDRTTEPGQLICDPFCGGGTILVDAKRLGRRWIGCEKDPDIAAIARRRLKETK